MLDVLGIEPPAMFKGVPQEDIAGASLKSTFEAPQAEEVRTLQYYEMYGSRAIYWMAGKRSPSMPSPASRPTVPAIPTLPFTQDKWELYDVAEDFSECHDLAAQEPERLQMMIGLWFAEAGKYDVFPLHAVQRKGAAAQAARRSRAVRLLARHHAHRQRGGGQRAHAAVQRRCARHHPRGRRGGRADRAGRRVCRLVVVRQRWQADLRAQLRGAGALPRRLHRADPGR